MKKCLAVILALVVFVGTTGATVLAQSEVMVVRAWIGSSIQVTDLPNIGLAPYISLGLGENIEITYSFAAMTQEEAWISLEIGFLNGELPKFKNSQIEINYSLSAYGAFMSQKDNEESVNSLNFGFLLGLETPIKINHALICLEGRIGIGWPPKLFVQLGVKIQLKTFMLMF
ncbi:hypothetical protein D4R86_00745 [bacterium]|nr:MAG: hypothetical protein D4R86_00745 [bacterium]